MLVCEWILWVKRTDVEFWVWARMWDNVEAVPSRCLVLMVDEAQQAVRSHRCAAPTAPGALADGSGDLHQHLPGVTEHGLWVFLSAPWRARTDSAPIVDGSY